MAPNSTGLAVQGDRVVEHCEQGQGRETVRMRDNFYTEERAGVCV